MLSIFHGHHRRKFYLERIRTTGKLMLAVAVLVGCSGAAASRPSAAARFASYAGRWTFTGTITCPEYEARTRAPCFSSSWWDFAVKPTGSLTFQERVLWVRERKGEKENCTARAFLHGPQFGDCLGLAVGRGHLKIDAGVSRFPVVIIDDERMTLYSSHGHTTIPDPYGNEPYDTQLTMRAGVFSRQQLLNSSGSSSGGFARGPWTAVWVHTR